MFGRPLSATRAVTGANTWHVARFWLQFPTLMTVIHTCACARTRNVYEACEYGVVKSLIEVFSSFFD